VLAADEPWSHADDPWKGRDPWLALVEPPAGALGHRKLDSLPRLIGVEACSGAVHSLATRAPSNEVNGRVVARPGSWHALGQAKGRPSCRTRSRSRCSETRS
jgi:hypothetical protein